MEAFLIGLGLVVLALGGWAGVEWLQRRRLNNMSGTARVTGRCGDTMALGLSFEDGRVTGTACRADGCTYSHLCLKAAADLAMGNTADRVLDVDVPAIRAAVEGLPEDHRHCAVLATLTLHRAVDDYLRALAADCLETMAGQDLSPESDIQEPA